MVSGRPSAERRLDTLARRPGLKWQNAAAGEIPLWLAEMDFALAPAIRAEIQRHLQQHVLGYGAGSEAAEQALRDWLLRRHAWKLAPGLTLWLSGVTQALATALLALTRPGDRVLLCTPCYPPLWRAIEQAGCQPLAWPLRPGQGDYRLDLQTLKRLLADSHPTLLILNTPHNPTGRVFSRAELYALGALLQSSATQVVSDEIFADIVFPGQRHTPFVLAAPECAARCVTLYSASKAFNLAGLKCAALICGTPALRARFNALSPSLLGSPGILALAACRAAWNDSEPWLDRTLARLERNRHQLFSGLRSQLPLLAGQPPQGTYLAWLDTAQLGLNEDAEAFFRRRARVDVAGGAAFGADYRHFIRIAFATPGLILQHALSAMATACLPPGPGAR